MPAPSASDQTYERLPALVSLVAVAALAWVYLAREASRMGMSMAGVEALAPGGVASLGSELALTFVMWSVMMAGMMLPSAIPAILLYAGIARKNAERGIELARVWIFAAGYLSVWIGFSALAATAQLGFAATGLLGHDMASSSVWLSSALLIVAGMYQWLPVKYVCLDKCRNPLQIFLMRWRNGRGGAWRMGLEHGTFCVGCCWALMLVLFVAGVMSLVWVALIAAFVFAEKLLPRGRLTGHVAGAGLMIAGATLPFLS